MRKVFAEKVRSFMNERNEILILIEEIDKTMTLIEDIDGFYREVQSNELVKLGKTRSTALIVSQIFENFYTCIETLFLRISQFFENDIAKEKWHRNLLDKMTLSIEGIRPAVIQNKTYKLLLELMRFRHFKRYYFELDYDWGKLDYLSEVYKEVLDLLKEDFNNFRRLLLDLSDINND
jgi:hypothetical protein